MLFYFARYRSHCHFSAYSTSLCQPAQWRRLVARKMRASSPAAHYALPLPASLRMSAASYYCWDEISMMRSIVMISPIIDARHAAWYLGTFQLIASLGGDDTLMLPHTRPAATLASPKGYKKMYTQSRPHFTMPSRGFSATDDVDTAVLWNFARRIYDTILELWYLLADRWCDICIGISRCSIILARLVINIIAALTSLTVPH